MPADLLAALTGLGLGLSLIVAIGSQNAFVLRQGLRRHRVGAVVASRPVLLDLVRIGGAAFLAVYGLMAARRALRPQALAPEGRAEPASVAATVGTALALTWLNPHVYLDTVVLLGSIAQSHHGRQWWFAAGAAVGSALWFTALGYGAALLRPLFAAPRAWRVLDAAIALIMLALATSLLLTTP